MKRFRGWRGGGAYVWWVTHRHEAKLGVLLLLLVVVMSTFFELRTYAAQRDKNEAVRALEGMKVLKTLPSTIFILEGSTVEQAQVKLARVAGELDMARHEMGKKK